MPITNFKIGYFTRAERCSRGRRCAAALRRRRVLEPRDRARRRDELEPEHRRRRRRAVVAASRSARRRRRRHGLEGRWHIYFCSPAARCERRAPSPTGQACQKKTAQGTGRAPERHRRLLQPALLAETLRRGPARRRRRRRRRRRAPRPPHLIERVVERDHLRQAAERRGAARVLSTLEHA